VARASTPPGGARPPETRVPQRLRVDEGVARVDGPRALRRGDDLAEDLAPLALALLRRALPAGELAEDVASRRAWIARKAPVPSRKSGSAISGQSTATGHPRSSSVTPGRSVRAGASASWSSYSRSTVPPRQLDQTLATSASRPRRSGPAPARGEPVDLLRDRHGDLAPGRRLAQRRERAPRRPDGEARPAGDGQGRGAGNVHALRPGGQGRLLPAAEQQLGARHRPYAWRVFSASWPCVSRASGRGRLSLEPHVCSSKRTSSRRISSSARRPSGGRGRTRRERGGHGALRQAARGQRARGRCGAVRPPVRPLALVGRDLAADLALQLPYRGGDGRQPEGRLEAEPVPGAHEVREGGQGRVVVPAPRVGDGGDDPGVRVAAGLQPAKLLDAAGVGLPHRCLVGARISPGGAAGGARPWRAETTPSSTLPRGSS